MKTLTIEHLAKHLSYGLKWQGETDKAIYTMYGIEKLFTQKIMIDIILETLSNVRKFKAEIINFKPILHPLSDLTKEIEHKGERFVSGERINKRFKAYGLKYYPKLFDIEDGLMKPMIACWPYEIVNKLLEWHFDIDGLIQDELAIDVNKLEINPYK